MTDNLRDRIAAALFDELDSDRQDWSGHLDMEALADAVIDELGLQREEMREFGPGKAVIARRYSTEWTISALSRATAKDAE